MLTAPRVVAAPERCLDPASPLWARARPVELRLRGTPLGTQPNAYLRASWKGRKIGAVERVGVTLCHDGERLFVRLDWADTSENRATADALTFPDGAAVLFPLGPDAPINTMGNAASGVNAWQWRADAEGGRSLVAFGLGTTEPTGDVVRASAARGGGRWIVIISRGLRPGTDRGVALAPGVATRIGVAVWEGSNGERAGFKAYTEDWTELRLEP